MAFLRLSVHAHERSLVNTLLPVSVVLSVVADDLDATVLVGKSIQPGNRPNVVARLGESISKTPDVPSAVVKNRFAYSL